GAPRAFAPGRSLTRRAPLRRAIQLLHRRVSQLRTSPPLHLRLLRRASGLQARLGLPRLLPLLLLHRALVGRRARQSAHAEAAFGRVRAPLLHRLDPVARGQLAEVPLQDPARGEALRPVGAGRREQRRQAALVQRLLAPVAPHQLSGRDPDGARADAGARLPGRSLALALPALLRRAPFAATALRRSALRRQVRRALAAVL